MTQPDDKPTVGKIVELRRPMSDVREASLNVWRLKYQLLEKQVAKLTADRDALLKAVKKVHDLAIEMGVLAANRQNALPAPRVKDYASQFIRAVKKAKAQAERGNDVVE